MNENQEILDGQLDISSKRRRALLPVWIKIFIWIFMITALIIPIGLFFGLLYNFLYYPHSLTEFAEAGSISILIGLFLGILEEFVFKSA